MTYADEEFLPEGQVETRNYPTAFGITFTPRVGGVIFAVLGLLGAAYLFVNAVQPAWEENQKIQGEITKIQDDIKKLEETQKKIDEKKAELEQAKVQNKQVLSLFANEKTLDTLLLNLNSFVKARNGALKLYKPGENTQSQTPDGVVNDGSLGPQVNGKLKRKTINVELEGSFDQIQSILRSFERLQTLLLVKDLKIETADEPIIVLVDPESGKSVPGIRKKDNQQKIIPGGKPTLKATFKLEALMPVTQEETNPAAGVLSPAAGVVSPGQKPKP
jgi:type IV pilus assembly protein PilO